MKHWLNKRPLRIFLMSALSTMAGNFTAVAAHAQVWPTKPITYIVPFAPGGTADGSARILANELGPRLGQPVVIQNRPGVSGIVGTQAGATAPADGYTLIAGTINTHAVNRYFYKTLGYDPVTQFVPVALLGVASNVLIVPTNSRFTSVQQIVDESRAKPGTLTYGSSGPGTSQNLAGELFQVMAGVKLQQVPYKGGSSALTDLVGGNLDMIFETETAARGMLQAKRVRALAVTSRDAQPSLPGVVPLSSMRGFETFDVQSWAGLFVPASTPQTIVDRLAKETLSIMAMPQVIEKMQTIGMTPMGLGTAEFSRFQLAEIKRWGDIVARAGIKPE